MAQAVTKVMKSSFPLAGFKQELIIYGEETHALDYIFLDPFYLGKDIISHFPCPYSSNF